MERTGRSLQSTHCSGGTKCLRYYLLVDSERLWTRVFFRKQGGDWFEQQLSREDMLEVQCDDVRLDLTLDDLYEDTGLLLV